MKLLTVLVCTLLLLSCVESRGGRGGGSRGGSRSSRSSSRSSTSNRGTRYYSRSSYSRSSVLTYMTIFAYSRIGYNRARYHRYNENDPEYCVYCNATLSNDTCIENTKTVCPQSSDCFYMTYRKQDSVSSSRLINKGCLYETYGAAGCAEQERQCAAAGNVNCTCSYCSEPYCNGAGHVTFSLLGLVLAGVCGHLLGRVV